MALLKYWHGGDLDDLSSEKLSNKKGRYEYGVGLYLTTSHEVVAKYTTGKRKLYLVTVESGNEISSSFLPVLVVKDFIKKYIVGNSKQEVFNRVSKYFEDDKVKANIFNNIILNCNGIKPSNTIKLRDLFIENGIDYELVDNAFGWGEEMMVLYNLKKIKSIERITDNSQKYKDSREFIDKIISEGLKKS
jgi:hypothetical protein